MSPTGHSKNKRPYFSIQAAVQLHQRSFGLLRQFAQNLHPDLRRNTRGTSGCDHFPPGPPTPGRRSHLAADGGRVLHRHHHVGSQRVEQDVGDVGAQGLQHVLGDVHLGFICASRGGSGQRREDASQPGAARRRRRENLPEKNLAPFSKSRMLLYRLVISSCSSLMLFFLLAPDGELLDDMKTERSTSW